MAFKLDGKTIREGQSFTHEGILYPRNWISKTSIEDKEALGMTWEADPVRHDDRYYWNGELNNPKAIDDKEEVDKDGVPLWEKVLDEVTKEMVDSNKRLVTKGLKSSKVVEVKHTAYTLLAQTDWYIVRKAERAIEVPANVVKERADALKECDRLEAAIAAAVDVASLKEVMEKQKW